MAIRLSSQVNTLKAQLAEARRGNRPIALIPTMGFLHKGHTSLIKAAHRDGCFTVVSIFVNPTQFGANEDLSTYPSAPDLDFEYASQAGADLVWYPGVSDLYPEHFQTSVHPGALAACLCGLSRPDFFSGVCTVVLKFFNLVRPDYAYFGEKDFQQLVVVRRMVEDFHLETKVIGCPTIREADGLAQSSRNVKLQPKNREQALTLYRTIKEAQAAFKQGARDPILLKQNLTNHWPEALQLDYLDFREPDYLKEVATLTAKTRIFLGAWLRGVRLIDNAPLG